jgi:hypothetical protein
MDNAPSPIANGGGIAAPASSMFQTDSTALKVRVPVSWALRAPAGMAWLTAANW